MTFAATGRMRLCLTTSEIVIDQVFCQCCDGDVGSMTAKTLMRALRMRGNILCPKCRNTKCDYCGLHGNEIESRVAHKSIPGLVLRRCYWCEQEKRTRPDYFYHSTVSHRKPGICLSSSPYLNGRGDQTC